MADPERAKCHKKLESLYDVAAACKDLAKHALLFGSFRTEIFGDLGNLGVDSNEQLQKKQNRAAYEATGILLASLVRVKLIKTKLQGLSEACGEQVPNLDAVLHDIGLLLLLDDPKDTQSSKTCKVLGRKELLAELPQLYDGIKHYIDLDPGRYEDAAELLFMFIKGLQPYPKCLFKSSDGVDCTDLAIVHDVPICNKHRCLLQLSLSGNQRCKQFVMDGQYYCSDHVCHSKGQRSCGRLRFGLDDKGKTLQSFCKVHCCFKCIELGRTPACEAQDDPPRHVCREVTSNTFQHASIHRSQVAWLVICLNQLVCSTLYALCLIAGSLHLRMRITAPATLRLLVCTQAARSLHLHEISATVKSMYACT